ncbi:hypothetical protein [Cereibacter johrii]|uniref:hypothetical protein n=1 Tax=Cereibacter johrii TaxID=445629 RepID=UPI00167E37B4|nr:hypothetical protein [Cereibacter johrii]
MRRAAELLRERAPGIAANLTREQATARSSNILSRAPKTIRLPSNTVSSSHSLLAVRMISRSGP